MKTPSNNNWWRQINLLPKNTITKNQWTVVCQGSAFLCIFCYWQRLLSILQHFRYLFFCPWLLFIKCVTVNKFCLGSVNANSMYHTKAITLLRGARNHAAKVWNHAMITIRNYESFFWYNLLCNCLTKMVIKLSNESQLWKLVFLIDNFITICSLLQRGPSQYCTYRVEKLHKYLQ